jgi:hypothetical protein
MHGIYACATIMSNRKGFPVELKNPKLERGDATTSAWEYGVNCEE